MHLFFVFSSGFGECLNGRCYRLSKRCDYYKDCEDGTDEAGCKYRNINQLKSLINRL